MDKEGKEGGFAIILVVMLVSIAIASFWDSVPLIKDSVHNALNPTLGRLIDWNYQYGMIIIVFILSIFMTLVQKYATDQATLKEIRKEQKDLQEEMKKYRDNPTKVMELNKKNFEFIGKTFKLNMRSLAITSLPLILLFRWFLDIFTALGNPRFFSIFNWFWFYLVLSIIFSSIFRKLLKVV